MDEKEQIIRLGRLLAEEERRGCDNSTVAGGLERFLTTWRMEAGDALRYEPVQQALELLAGYAVLDQPTRRARVGIALESLRSLFRAQPASHSSAAPQVTTPTRAPVRRPSRPAPASARPLTPDSPLEDVPGITRIMVQSFRRLGVRTVRDLLYHFPHRYDDFTSHRLGI
jgi:ATP-dependent DNA helicase RecG